MAGTPKEAGNELLERLKEIGKEQEAKGHYEGRAVETFTLQMMAIYECYLQEITVESQGGK